MSVLTIGLMSCGALWGCGNNANTVDGPPVVQPEAGACESLGATGQINRRAGNPRLIAGHQFPDGKLDISMSDPDVHRNAATSTWELYYMAAHTMAFSDPDPPQLIRHASSADRQTWTVDDAPALTAATDVAAWDHLNTETPTVVVNPDAPPDRRYLMMYSGASRTFPFPNYGFPEYGIGAAFSADGKTFTRVPASMSKDGKAGLVLRGADVYPGTVGSIVADPELAYVGGMYHLFFSSFACTGTTCDVKEAYGVAHATSPDGITWTVGEAPIKSLLRASANATSGGGQPSVIYDARHCRWELWLTSDLAGEHDDQPVVFNNMTGVWHADSMNGVDWHVDYTRNRDLQWSAAEAGEHLGLLTGADFGADDSGRLMVYVGFDDQNVPTDFFLPDHTSFRPGVMTLNIATRDLP